MNRPEMCRRARSRGGLRGDSWDMVIIGGGATGTGCAIDAAARGYHVLLLEQSDFGKGTSSRSTKLVHGGVRYLEQGNVSLVIEALKERGLLLKNAPHLVSNLGFVVPRYDWWEAPFYGVGLKIYDLLAGKYGFGSSRILSREETLQRLPTINPESLLGGVIYFDGQFDDARLLIYMVATAFEQGATLLNYAPVTALTRDENGFVNGVVAIDLESGEEIRASAKVVVNATGAFSDTIRRQADPEAEPIIAPSQGIHLVFDRSFLPGDTAIMVPHTSDGRVMFAIPWHEHTLVGTTDTPVPCATLEPVAMHQEIDFILGTASQYLAKKPSRDDVLSVFAGIRPLVKSDRVSKTATLSRDHVIQIDGTGMVTICGGKWTTYRHMAEDCVTQAAILAQLPEKACVTRDLNIHGFHPSADQFGDLRLYGSNAPEIQRLGLNVRLHPALPYTEAEVLWSVREEMARTVEDVLARRTRALFLNARAAIAAANRVAEIMAVEMARGEHWRAGQVAEFTALAANYIL